MALTLYNVRTRQKEPFTPRQPGKVGVYLCGLTVYDHMHIGHARTAVSFEVVRRWLEHHYDEVTFSQNVTDVDDKIIARAQELGVSPLEHADTWDKECQKQSARLGVRAPDIAPHATTSMDGIIAYIEGILERGFAYATDAGNVYFDVPKYDAYAQEHFPEQGYGSLSNRDYREMAAGTRKDVESDKQHPADFALWKAAKEDEPADAQWDSPWGKGRPGWHIECSHMSTHTLGAEQIDIHGGGQDLIFPHHENEIAQTQAKTGKAPFVNVWMHSGFLNVEGVKMSKSLGNFITLKDALDDLEDKEWDPEVLRFYFVQTHYRSKIDFSRKGLDEAATAVERLRRTRVALARATGEPSSDAGLGEAAAKLIADAHAALDDDIHTPGAVAALFDFTKAANKALDAGAGGTDASQALAAFESVARLLTLFDDVIVEDALPDFEALLTQREAARAAKDWGTADRIRDEIQAAGYRIEDTPNGARVVKS
ncbi:MAG: cysteine--tRNA ligase [Thermoplasmatota archaeon]